MCVLITQGWLGSWVLILVCGLRWHNYFRNSSHACWNPKQKETLPASVDGAFEGGNGSFRHFRMRLRQVCGLRCLHCGVCGSALDLLWFLLPPLWWSDTWDCDTSGGRFGKATLFALYSERTEQPQVEEEGKYFWLPGSVNLQNLWQLVAAGKHCQLRVRKSSWTSAKS